MVRAGSRPHFGQTEIEDLHRAVAGQEHVLRFEVTMNDPPIVGAGQSLRDLDRRLDRSSERQGTIGEPLAQRGTLQKLLHDVGASVVHPHIMHRHDVGMLECGGGLGLLLEAPKAIGRNTGTGCHHLDGHVPTQPRIPRAIHLAHRARPDGCNQFIWPDSSALGHRVRQRRPAPRLEQCRSLEPLIMGVILPTPPQKVNLRAPRLG
jgi:hypothetical protein